MAGLSNADPSQHSAVGTPPLPISKEMQGSDSAPPLSPQWLLPKLGDNKLGLATGDLDSHAGKHTDPAKVLGNVEDHNVVEKRKDIYRPSFYDMDKGRRDRWGDEERESIPAIRRDLRREGEELGDFRKVERSSNTASRYSGEARRFSTDRWTESGSRESAYEPRRESKWNTRWGPDDKELENRREKWPGKAGEISNDKGAQHLTIHAKDVNSQGKDADKDGEHHNRSWRSSHALNRGKGETSAYLLSTTNKPALMFGYGRGKGDSGGAVLSADRGRAGSIASNVSRGSMPHFPSDTTSDKFNSSQKDPPILKYNRMKLLDIFRTTNLEGYKMSFEGFQEFTSFMQADLLMPQALTLPTAEELVIMEAIDKGDILSSGTPLASKDGSGGKNSVESGLLQTKSGIAEDVGPVVTDHRDVRASHGKKDHSCNMEGTSYDKSFQDFDSKVVPGEVSSFLDVLSSEAFKYEGPPNKPYDSVKGELSKMENIIPLRSQMEGVGSLRSLALTEDRSGTSDMGWLNTRKDMVNDMRNMRADSLPNLGGDAQWQDSTNLQLESRIRRQPSETFNGQGDSSLHRDKLMDRKQQYPSLEHLLLLYKDPQGQIQGPFSGSNLIEWFDAGYFGVDLLVRLASAPPDTPFSLLGDVIPQLRTRVRPPPGFGAVRQSNIVEAPGRGKVGGPGGIHAGVSDFELIKSGQLLKNDSAVEAENRFLESLMSARINSSLTDSYLLPEVMQGYNALAGGRPSIGIENTTDVKYLPHKTPLEQLNHALYQPGRESPAMLSHSDTTGEFTIPKIIVPQIVEASHHTPQSLQQMDLLSALQSATDKTQPPINSSLPLWPNLSEAQALKNTHGSMDLMKDTFELHPNQQISQTGFGVPPHMLQPQCQPPLSNQTPVGNLSSGVIPPEKLTSSEFNQDAQMVNLLRQQYMLTQQLHSQLPFPSHLNQMELLLLMQRQKLEQQQSQLLMQQQQQQHFLSHALSAHHLHMHSDEQPFRPINTEMHEMAQINRQLHAHDSNDSYDMSCHSSNLNWLGAQEANITASVEHPPLNLPNQIINLTSHSNSLKASLLDVGPIQTSSVDQMAFIPNIVSTEQSSLQDAFVPLLDSTDVGTLEVSQALSQTKDTITIMSDAISGTVLSENREDILDSKPSLTDMNDSIKNYPVLNPEQVHDETPVLKEVEDSEQCEVKKASEKKLRRHKNSKLRAAAESGKESVKASPGQKSKTTSDIREAEKDYHLEPAELQCRATLEAGGENCDPPLLESLETHVSPLSSGALDTKTKVNEIKIKEGESVQSWSNNHAWKPTQVQKTKSLLEIQVEEQRMAQTQSLTAGIPSEIIQTSVSAALSDQKYVLESVQYDRVSHRQDEILHNISGAKDHTSSEEKCTSSLTLQPQMRTEIEESVDDGNFIEAKDTRKSRKKAAKNKCAVKASLPSNSVALPVHASALEQAKAPFQTQQDNILLPSPPSAPSFGDFVFWKGDQPSTAPPPAWFTDSVKLQKPAYLRDIFKEQDKNRKAGLQQSPIPTPTKVQSSKMSGGSCSSVLVPGSSPSKVPLPINSKSASLTQTNFLSLGHQKTGMEDDLFWGPLDQGNEGNRSDFPSLANPTSQKVKGTPVKSAYAEVSSKKAYGSKSAEHSNTISPAISRSLSKGKQDTESKYSEAMDFLNWCETEWLRLTGTNDTSFLEFCLKQPTAEAAILLRENLASLDRDHDEFIDKFINCKDFLPPGIIEAAVDRRRSKGGGIGAPPNRDAAVMSNEACDGKKKGGKKGRKLNPALLGFNVVSNRIMMGEIQAIED